MNLRETWLPDLGIRPTKNGPRLSFHKAANGEFFWRARLGSRIVSGPEETYKRRDTMLRVVVHLFRLTAAEASTLWYDDKVQLPPREVA